VIDDPMRSGDCTIQNPGADRNNDLNRQHGTCNWIIRDRSLDAADRGHPHRTSPIFMETAVERS